MSKKDYIDADYEVIQMVHSAQEARARRAADAAREDDALEGRMRKLVSLLPAVGLIAVCLVILLVAR